MLIITRKDQETIVIDETIVITVIGLSRSRVGLGIKAPGHHVRRGELAPRNPDAGTETADAKTD